MSGLESVRMEKKLEVGRSVSSQYPAENGNSGGGHQNMKSGLGLKIMS